MKMIFQLIIFLWIALSIVLGLLSALRAEREDLAYRQVFLWLISPGVALAGLIFLDKGRKKRYFSRMNSHLFIKE
ncbi:MAG: hypothetical protein WCT13_06190 [Patescibacteria group bacterium]